MKIWGIHKPYPALSWWENFMGGHINIGPITIFGANAMNWTVNITTKRWGHICFTLPVLARWQRWRHDDKKKYRGYFYISPNGTPQASTFYYGYDKQEAIRARIRRYNFGLKFNTNKLRNELYTLNHKFEWMQITDYDVERFGLHTLDRD